MSEQTENRLKRIIGNSTTYYHKVFEAVESANVAFEGTTYQFHTLPDSEELQDLLPSDLYEFLLFLEGIGNLHFDDDINDVTSEMNIFFTCITEISSLQRIPNIPFHDLPLLYKEFSPIDVRRYLELLQRIFEFEDSIFQLVLSTYLTKTEGGDRLRRWSYLERKQLPHYIKAARNKELDAFVSAKTEMSFDEPPRPPLKLKWTGQQTDLVMVLDGLKSSGYLDIQDNQVFDHFDYNSSATNPSSTYRQTRSKLKGGASHPEKSKLTQFIEYLKTFDR